MTSTQPKRRVIIWGASGHALVLSRILAQRGDEVFGACDRRPGINQLGDQIRVWRTEEDFLHALQAEKPGDLFFVAAVGGANGWARIIIEMYLRNLGLRPLTLIHPQAYVDETVSVGDGSQIVARACVSVGVTIGRQCIVNTSATLDHEVRLGDGVHVMPAAVLAGCVETARLVTVGSNATVLPNLKIGEGAIIGAGAVVTRDVEAWTVVTGCPARRQRALAPLDPFDGVSTPWT